MEEQPDFVYYLYVVERGEAPPAGSTDESDDDIPEYLLGVVTLRQLVNGPPDAPLAGLMRSDIVTAPVTDRADDAARLLIEYGLYALPVVGDGRRDARHHHGGRRHGAALARTPGVSGSGSLVSNEQ